MSIVYQAIERRAQELEREAAFLREHLRTAGAVLLHEAEHAEQFLKDAYRRAMDFSHPIPQVVALPDVKIDTEDSDKQETGKNPAADQEEDHV